MKNNEKVIYGLLITIVIFLTAIFVRSKIELNSSFFPSTFISHSTMLLLSIIAIITLKKEVNFKISAPKFRTILKPILLGIAVTIVINILLTIATKIVGGEPAVHPLVAQMKPMQVLIFVFFYASFAEEILFRGFLLNLLRPLKTKGATLFNRKISLPVIISAAAFGLSHLILITAGVDALFLVRVVSFTFLLGLVAGYYQEKYDNTTYAIIVHMAGNSLAVIAIFVMSMNP